MLNFRNIILLLILLLIHFNVLAAPADTQYANFIALSDIHFDPFYACKKNVINCPVVKELIKNNPENWGSVLARYGNGEVSPYRKDSNYALLKSALAAAQQTAKQSHPKFVIILGDFLGHNYSTEYQLYSGDLSQHGYDKFVKKTIKFLTLQIRQAFPGLAVYPVVGNNDSYTGDYGVVPNGKFFTDTTKIWIPLLKYNTGTFTRTFSVAGYYAVTPANQPRLRLIVLNTILFAKLSNTNTQKAALQELNWLKAQLQLAKENHQKVWLIAHVPMGINVFSSVKLPIKKIIPFWVENYTKLFQAILNEYSSDIAVMLTSHLHMDGFQILKATQPIPNSFVPAVSPIFGNNPAFKDYEYSTKNLELEDFITYYLNEAGAANWQEEYRMYNYYQSSCESCTLLSRMQTIEKTGLTAHAYKAFYAVSTSSQPITQGKWVPYYWCAIRNNTAEEYRGCVASN